MPWVAGADGCRKAWVRVAYELETHEICVDVLAVPAELIERPPSPEILGIDIPIGLPPSDRRICDHLAKALLGRRGASVFWAPPRLARDATDQPEANALARRARSPGVSIQAFCLLPKIRSMDDLLVERSDLRHRIVEVHPEVSFAAWNEGSAMRWRKKSVEGRQERAELVAATFGPNAFAAAREKCVGSGAAADDILDAFTALWTAIRIFERRAVTLPAQPFQDAVGLPMRIVF